VLRKLNLRIDQDDRIALLGRNGEGKSTLSKLLAGKLETCEGRVTRSSKLRIGYFAQHQVDELHIDETPLQHIMRLRPGEGQPRLRARLVRPYRPVRSGGLRLHRRPLRRGAELVRPWF
jgi:ATP-binding cassette subfamily F protein 3